MAVFVDSTTTVILGPTPSLCPPSPITPLYIRTNSAILPPQVLPKPQLLTTTSYHAHSMASCTTLYQILGIRATASAEEIKAAYRRLARICHPDAAPVDRKESSAGEFMKIHAAYCTLSDPEKRASYDRSLFRRQRPLTTTSSRFSGYSGRNWETDQCW
ncbi:Chaperone protein dnaJ 11, chloroplastic, partial [Mucuna pruriens]